MGARKLNCPGETFKSWLPVLDRLGGLDVEVYVIELVDLSLLVADIGKDNSLIVEM